ncbi:MAG: NAD(P)H-binding protein [Deltaproteobacteria bacterium]
MIVVAGGTGRLGRLVVERLRGSGEEIRTMSRSDGDVRDRAAADRAVAGARVVISAISAFGRKGVTPREVDDEGNANLITAAERQGVERFVLISVHGASPDHAMELARMKHRAERRLIASRLRWTILRPTTFIETFQEALCAPLLARRKAVVLGHARNPVNFVSAHDVARVVEVAVLEQAAPNSIVELGGPENLSLVEFVEAFAGALGLAISIKHVPQLALRVLSQLARPFNPMFARMAQAGVVMDTTDMTFDARELVARYPQIAWTTVVDAARRDYLGAA